MLGLIAEPGLAEEVTRKIADQLPDLWEQEADKDGRPVGCWRVETVAQLLPLGSRGRLPLLRVGQERQERHGWDAVVVMTELPRRAGPIPCWPTLRPPTAWGSFR
ncbi:hypothetical protein [Streptomyces smyrnaeus]|uniref:hypothetical protein n=1 Tax=Streptomyces smyrnaeus TaxID=1387713 RepID=UPI0036987BB7